MVEYEQHTTTFDDDKTIFYLATGPSSGPLIVLMHGWPGISKTWYAQINVLAALGFRVVAPDMPGYGRSTAIDKHSDYSQENIVRAMLAVLSHVGREKAIWAGHDWGCGTLWTLANTHPQVCRAVIGLCVPAHSIELGLDELVQSVDRARYPESEYPYGQWAYQIYYQRDFDKAAAWHNKGIHGFVKTFCRKGDPATVGKPYARLANVLKDGGFMGGIPQPPDPETIPDDAVAMDHGVLKELVASMERTGFRPADAWYMNHEANRNYNLTNAKNDLKLAMPVLFINARYDGACDTVTGHLADRMRRDCQDLTEVIIDAGHWVHVEKPEETNSAILKWLIEKVADWWPGPDEVKF